MISLKAGESSVDLDPQTGGAIGSMRYRELALLRAVADPRLAAQHGRAVAAYPLIPYANRIAWSRFAFGGESFVLDRNFGDHPHVIHGNAWMHPWDILQADERSAHLAFDHAPIGPAAREWPFAYHAEQIFAVRDKELSVLLSLANTDQRAWPAGLGLHPYVARGAGTRLRFEADVVWTNDSDDLPREREVVEGAYEFDRGQAVGSTPIDNCFAGWGGVADIDFLPHGISLRIEADPPLDHLQVYTPAGEDFMGLEPVMNMPDAVNRIEDVADQGLRVLMPGERIEATIRFRVIVD